MTLFADIGATWAKARRPLMLETFFASLPILDAIKQHRNVRTNTGDHIAVPYYDATTGLCITSKVDWPRVAVVPLGDVSEEWNTLRSDAAPNELLAALDATTHPVLDTLIHRVGHALYNDPDHEVDPIIDPLREAINDQGTYKGIADQASQFKRIMVATVNTTGGPLTLDLLQQMIGHATYGASTPNLITTTGVLYQKIRTLLGMDPQEHGHPHIYKAQVVPDAFCPPREIHIFNTNVMEYWMLDGLDLRFDGPYLHPHYEDRWDARWVLCGNLIVRQPCLQARLENVT
jgi:hypothetical protein